MSSDARAALFAEIDRSAPEAVDHPAEASTSHSVDPRLESILRTRPLPVRFQDATQFKHRPRTQHPLYQTSSNAYGQERPNQSQFPQQWHGIQGEFTKKFTGGAPRNNGFVVSVSKSKVHKLLDD